jgi:hypothetical protein
MLQTAREKWRFSQRELSTRLGPIIQKFGPISRRESYPSRSAISNIERGKEELAADDIRLKALLEILCLDEAAFAQGNIVYTARPPAIPISPASQKTMPTVAQPPQPSDVTKAKNRGIETDTALLLRSQEKFASILREAVELGEQPRTPENATRLAVLRTVISAVTDILGKIDP